MELNVDLRKKKKYAFTFFQRFSIIDFCRYNHHFSALTKTHYEYTCMYLFSIFLHTYAFIYLANRWSSARERKSNAF